MGEPGILVRDDGWQGVDVYPEQVEGYHLIEQALRQGGG